MKKWYKICGFLGFCLTIGQFSIAQNALSMGFRPKMGALFFSQKPDVQKTVNDVFPLVKNAMATKNISLGVSPATATHQFGFFCRAELKADAVLKVPVRFRLGSLQYCNYMEGKTNRLPER
jgi:hypothetical protein